MLTIYNSLFNRKENFMPMSQEQITMYVCGPTVYNQIHVGNARSVIVFDLLYRILKKEYKEVVYVRNITDIDDKIIKKAKEEGKTCSEVSLFWEESFKENCKKLQLLEPDQEPRATDTIKEIIEAVAELIENNYAYVNEDQVMFRISELEEYGKLSKQNNTEAGKRIAISELKESDEDFVLWKPSKVGEPYWNSPWGKGRPGWHIECTAMSAKFLGERFDIHGGGQDLMFPHHENEIAQNIGLYGKSAGPRYWMHNAMVLFDGQKMSKSLGNIILLSQAFAEYDPCIIKFFILSAHYRHQLIWTDENLKQAHARYRRWMFHLEEYKNDEKIILDEVYQALLDDINTPKAFAVFEEILTKAIKNKDKELFKSLYSTLNWFALTSELKAEDSKEKLEALLEERLKAKANKDYKRADEIREIIEKFGYELIDSQDGQILKKTY